MLVVFPPIFVADTKIIYGYNFVAPLKFYVVFLHLHIKEDPHRTCSDHVETFISVNFELWPQFRFCNKENTKIVYNISHHFKLITVELMFRCPIIKFFKFSNLFTLIDTKSDRESFTESVKEGEYLETCWSCTSLRQSKSFKFFF